MAADLLPDDRLGRILDLLEEHRALRASHLAERLAVSVDTIRRDLDRLAAEGRIERIRGGARVAAPTRPVPPPLHERLAAPDPVRGRLAAAAAARLPRHGLLVLGGGSTMVELAAHLTPAPGLQVLTPNPAAAVAAAAAGRDVELIGGRIERERVVAGGALAAAQIAAARPDVLVLAPCALDAGGLTMHDRDEAELVRVAAGNAREVIAVADAARVGTVAPWPALALDRVDLIVTDAPAAASARLAAAGPQVLRA